MPAPRATTSSPSAWRMRAAAAAIGCLLTGILTFPTVRDFSSAGRIDSGDGRFSIWNVAWVAHALTDPADRLFDANIFAPHRDTLTYSELNLVAGALAAPVYAITRNPIAAHNAAVLLALWMAFMATWALVRTLTGSFGAGVVSGAGYAFSAYTSSHTAEIQLLMLFGFPLTMLAFHRLARRPTIGAGAGLGLALAVTGLSCGYYGVFAAGLAGLATLWWAQRSRAYWVAMVCAVLVAAAAVSSVLIPYERARARAGASSRANPDLVRVYSASWSDYLKSGTAVQAGALEAVEHVVRAIVPGGTPAPLTEVLFPGWVIGALAIVGLAGARTTEFRWTTVGYAVIAAAAVWASFGPAGGLYRLIALLPGAALLRAPARLGIVAIFAVCVLAGFGLRHLLSGRRWLAPVCLAVVVAELWVAWPLRQMPPMPRAYALLRTLPRGGVVEFPFSYVRGDFHQHTWAMLRSTANWQPLLNGYSDYTPADFYEMAEPINGFPDARSFEILRAHQARYVVVRLNEYGDGEYRERLLARFPPYDRYLRRLTNDQDVWLYEIVAWPEARP